MVELAPLNAGPHGPVPNLKKVPFPAFFCTRMITYQVPSGPPGMYLFPIVVGGMHSLSCLSYILFLVFRWCRIEIWIKCQLKGQMRFLRDRRTTLGENFVILRLVSSIAGETSPCLWPESVWNTRLYEASLVCHRQGYTADTPNAVKRMGVKCKLFNRGRAVP